MTETVEGHDRRAAQQAWEAALSATALAGIVAYLRQKRRDQPGQAAL